MRTWIGVLCAALLAAFLIAGPVSPGQTAASRPCCGGGGGIGMEP